MKTSNSLKVLLIDPCFHDRGISISYIPLSIGLVGSYLKHHISEVDLKIMKLASNIVAKLSKITNRISLASVLMSGTRI